MNWFWEMYQRGQDKNQDLVRSWLYPTHTGIRYQGAKGKALLADDKALVPSYVWDEEYLCIPGANQFAVFRFFDQCILPDGADRPKAPQTGKVYVIGLDLGRARDHTCLVVLEFDRPTMIGTVVHAEQFQLGLAHSEMAISVGAVARFWNAVVVMDTTGGATGGHRDVDSYVQEYAKHIPNLREFYWGPANKEGIIAELALWTEQKRVLVHPVFKPLIDQMRAYEIRRSGTHRPQFGPTAGMHDDYVAALAQAVHGCKSNWFVDSAYTSVAGIL
jgi:hypothetical protein